MTRHEQLAVIVEGRTWEAVQQHLGGDWSRRNELFTISQADFDAWADSIQLPFGRVQDKSQTWDGIYVLQEGGRWVVFEQERGCRTHECGKFSDFNLAKREALSTEHLNGIVLRKA